MAMSQVKAELNLNPDPNVGQSAQIGRAKTPSRKMTGYKMPSPSNSKTPRTRCTALLEKSCQLTQVLREVS